MHLRGRVRLGGLLCVLALAALVVSAADAAGPESTHAAASEHGGGGLISLDKSLIVQAVNFVIQDRKSTRLELQSQSNLVCRLLLEKKKKKKNTPYYQQP